MAIDSSQRNTELDRVKSTITLSLGTKNRLRALKGSMSYEDFINYLLRTAPSSQQPNLVELSKFQRIASTYSWGNYKISFAYNRHNASPQFQFDIHITHARKDGEKMKWEEALEDFSGKLQKPPLETEFRLYFELLILAVQKEIAPLFKHKGTFEDYFSWKEEFRILNLPESAFEEDVMQKLLHYKRGLHYND